MKKFSKRPPLLVVLFLMLVTVCLIQICAIQTTYLSPPNGFSSTTTRPVLVPRHSSTSLLPLQKVWKDYKDWHSEESLKRHPWNRRFQVVYYSCPHAAGNFLHDFFNQVIVAIASNRTMLWKFYDQETCDMVNSGNCLHSNREADCSRCLVRTPWLPSYDEWAPKLFPNNNSDDKNITLPIRHPTAYNSSDWINNNTHRPLIALKAMIFPVQMWRHEKYLNNTAATKVLQQLYSSTAEVLYGMLFRELFTFHPDIIPPEYDNHDPPSQQAANTRKYALHSRHRSPQDKGFSIENEKNCLESLLGSSDEEEDGDDSVCTVYIMSDREVTPGLIADYIRAKWPHCTPIVTTHIKDTGHSIAEHGPAAGAGFFQDLLVASQAHDGFIGHCGRTSSQLLKELIQYDRTMETIQNIGNPPNSDLPTCCLPDKQSR